MSELFNPDGLVLSANYASTMDDVVLPYLTAHGTDENVSAFDGTKLYVSRYRSDAQSRGSVFLVHGFTESAVKFSELIYSLLQNGFDVVAYDQRGHGRSGREEGLSDPSVTHVEHFDDYEKDFASVCKAMEGKMPKPWCVFCHSMGGAVTALFLMRHPDVFSRAALCAPMIAVNRKHMPFFLLKAICRAFRIVGKGKQLLFISKPYSGLETFEGACATGRERFEWYALFKDTHPAFQNYSPSYAWLSEALGVSQKLLWPTAPKKIACPVKIYSAGDDWEVNNFAQKLFVRGLKQGQLVTVDGAYHEIYRSKDETLFPWWNDVLGFLQGS